MPLLKFSSSNDVIQSPRDAQLLLDVGHHRVRQARLAEFREVLTDNALPYDIVMVGGRNDLVIERNITRRPAPNAARRPTPEWKGLPPAPRLKASPIVTRRPSELFVEEDYDRGRIERSKAGSKAGR